MQNGRPGRASRDSRNVECEVIFPGDGGADITVACLGQLVPFDLDVSRLREQHAPKPIPEIEQGPALVPPHGINPVEKKDTPKLPKAPNAMKTRGRPTLDYEKMWKKREGPFEEV